MKAKGTEASSINTYTSCYKDYPEGDERKFAESVNRYCGTKQNFIYPDDEDALSVLEKMIWHMEGLAEFCSMGGFLPFREVSRTGVKGIINGQRSDEIMFGYERYYQQYLKTLREIVVKTVRNSGVAVSQSRINQGFGGTASAKSF